MKTYKLTVKISSNLDISEEEMMDYWARYWDSLGKEDKIFGGQSTVTNLIVEKE